jgi:adenylate cyclase
MSGESPNSEAGQPSHTEGDSSGHASHSEAAPTHSHVHLPQVQGLLGKLRQRHVGRVALLYVGVCYVILEPFEMFFHLLELPAWTGRTVVLLMVIGFPVTLLYAWIYEARPTRVTAGAPDAQAMARQRGRKLDYAIIGVLVVALTYFVADKFWLSKRVAVAPEVAVSAPTVVTPVIPVAPDKSVAVLPFVDMSEKKDQEYFSDGLSEELIDHLAHSPDLKVISRTSSFQFKGKNEDMRTIGQRLGVANLLEGSVRTSGGTIRVTAQLINVTDGLHLWSETYDRKMGDIFKLQDEIAAAVVAALKATMSAPKRANAKNTNIESYNKVLLARYLNFRGTKQDSERALAAVDEAIKIDPDNASAWVTLGGTYYVRAIFNWMPGPEAYIASRKAIEHALAIDPDSATAHRMLALVEDTLNHNPDGYRREIKRAVELDPSLANPLDAGIQSFRAGNVREAAQLIKRAAALDPLDAWTLTWLGIALYSDNDLPGAERAARQILDINPDYAGAHCQLGEILLAQHNPAEALTVMSKETDEAARLTCMPVALWTLGRQREANALLEEAKAKYRDSSAYALAYCYTAMGDKDEAFKWLNVAYENHDISVQYVNIDPDFRALRSDPRFNTLVGKVNAR